MRSRVFFVLILASVAHAGSATTQNATQEKVDSFMSALDKLASLSTFMETLSKLPPSDGARAFDKLTSLDGQLFQGILRYKYMQYAAKGLIDPTTQGRESLRCLFGLNGVRAFVSPALKECGVTEEMVKTRAELRLRQSGLLISEPPLDPNGYRAWMSSHPGSVSNWAGLHVYMESISLSKADVMAVDIQVCQSQIVNLLSVDRPTFMLVNIWEHGQHVIGSRERMAQGCWEAMNELLDVYCNDWLTVHPSRRTQPPSDPNEQRRDKKE